MNARARLSGRSLQEYAPLAERCETRDASGRSENGSSSPNDGRNRSRFEWVHVIRITGRPERPPPTVVEFGDADTPGRAMVDEVEMVHKDDLEDRRGSLSPATMRAIDAALRRVFSLN